MAEKERISLWVGPAILGWLKTKKDYNGESASHFVRETLRQRMEAEHALDHPAHD